MKARRFLNVAIGQYYDGGSLGRITNPNKHLFYPSTAEAQQHQIQRAAAAKAKDKPRKSTAAASSDDDCDGTSAPPEKDYDVLRVVTPKFRFKASSHPGGSTGMLDSFPSTAAPPGPRKGSSAWTATAWPRSTTPMLPLSR